MAENESQLQYVHRTIDDRLKFLKSSTAWYRTQHFISLLSSILLSASITVIAGLKLSIIPELAASTIILVLGAIATVSAIWGAFLSPKELWHLNAETYSKLFVLRTKLEFSERGLDFGENAQKILGEVLAEYEKINADYIQKWQQLRQKSQ